MYESHWSLASRPFENRADSNFYFPSEGHDAARLKLHYAIESRRAVAVLCGEAGVGKSMMLERVFGELPQSIEPIARINYPAMPADQLLGYTVRQWTGLDRTGEPPTIGQSIELLDQFLRFNASEGRHALVVIDESQLLESHGTLEPLRLLLNLAVDGTDAESAFTLVLSGSIPLLAHLSRNPALEDRIAVRCVLERFDLQETAAYMGHRLRVAGAQHVLFSNESIHRIQQYTTGIPRRINRLCDLALMIGYAQDLQRIEANVIDLAQRELSTTSAAA